MAASLGDKKQNFGIMPLVLIACFFVLGVWSLANAYIMMTTGVRPRYVSMSEAGLIYIAGDLFGETGKIYFGSLFLALEGIFFIVFPFYFEFWWSRKHQLSPGQKSAMHHAAIWAPVIFLLAGAAIFCEQYGYFFPDIILTIVMVAVAIYVRIAEPKDNEKSEPPE
jgi:hypothetical protein